MPKSESFGLDTIRSVLKFFQDERNMEISVQCNLGTFRNLAWPYNERAENLKGDELVLYELLKINMSRL